MYLRNPPFLIGGFLFTKQGQFLRQTQSAI